VGKPAATDRPRLTPLSHSFTLEEMEVFGHDDMADDEVMALPDFFQHLRKQVAMAGGFEQLPIVF
jgi:hypothetical protein